jgi:hypothetical protein
MSRIDTHAVDAIETQRLKTQHRLDTQKAQTERNKLGQFATPTALATEILEYAKRLIPKSQPIRFLDPAFGTGSFYAALLRSFPPSRTAQAQGYEIDPHYGDEAATLWRDMPLDLNIADFTRTRPPATDGELANLLICNPPYVRHHHLSSEQKLALQMRVKQLTGLKLSGLAGLYCYFLLISHAWMVDGGLAGWLIPSEFMDVNYGKQVKHYLLHHVTLLHIHRFDPDEVQFEDALVSSVVVWIKKEEPPTNHQVRFSYGGDLKNPRVSQMIPANSLNQIAKWTTLPNRQSTNNSTDTSTENEHKKLALSDLFTIKRGLVTGANKFFILTLDQISEHQLPSEFLIPILPSPRYLSTNEIEADEDGNPVLKQRLFLLACDLSESQVQKKYPHLWDYLQIGIEKNINSRYLCRHRTPWYSQEDRPPAPLVCTYMGRQTARNGKPFRFILNHSKATAPNVYLMLYPKPVLEQEIQRKPELLKFIWQTLNDIPPNTLIGEGRVYGGGLHKIEPNELANAPIYDIAAILPEFSANRVKQLSFFD